MLRITAGGEFVSALQPLTCVGAGAKSRFGFGLDSQTSVTAQPDEQGLAGLSVLYCAETTDDCTGRVFHRHRGYHRCNLVTARIVSCAADLLSVRSFASHVLCTRQQAKSISYGNRDAPARLEALHR